MLNKKDKAKTESSLFYAYTDHQNPMIYFSLPHGNL